MSPRPILSLAQTQKALGPFVHRAFVEPHIAAVDEWQELLVTMPRSAAAMNDTARANAIHCWVERNVRTAIHGLNGIREIEALKFFVVAIGQNPLVRFKFCGNGGPSNVQTEQQKNLAQQKYDEDVLGALAMEGVPGPPTFMTCGYGLDDVGQLTKVEIECRYRGSLMFRWPIWGDQADTGPTVEPTHLRVVPPAKPAAVRSTRKVKKPKED